MRSILTLLFILSLSSCKKDDASPDIYTGEASALKNAEEWIAKAYFDIIKIPSLANPPKFILRADVYNSQNFWRETFAIRQLEANFHKQGIISLDRTNEEGLISSNYSTLIDDGDVLGDIYILDTTAIDNFIQILTYNSSKAQIEGVFNVTMVLSRDDEEGETPPQKLVFTNGTFGAKVKREWFE